MRATTFAVGLSMAATTALAQAQNTSPAQADTQVTLTNGCVYTQNRLAEGNAWSLIYTQAGTIVQCPLTVYGLTASTAATAPVPAFVPEAEIFDDLAPTVTRTQTDPVDRPTQRITFNPSYIVGVFR